METKPKNGKMQRGLIVLVGGNGSQPFPVVGRLVGELRGAVLPEPNGDPTRHGEDVIMGDAAALRAVSSTTFEPTSHR